MYHLGNARRAELATRNTRTDALCAGNEELGLELFESLKYRGQKGGSDERERRNAQHFLNLFIWDFLKQENTNWVPAHKRYGPKESKENGDGENNPE